jgi:CRP-like cAMP-binding protein
MPHMTDLPMPKSSAAAPGRRADDEEEIIRRLSAEAKLRIYEEVKDLLDAKAARDARRAAPTPRSGASPAAEPAPAPSRREIRPPQPAAQRSGKSADADDVLVFNEEESFDLKSVAGGARAALDSSALEPKGRSGQRGADSGRDGKSKASAASMAAEARPVPSAGSRRFTLLTGLDQDQVRMLKACGSRQKFEEGEPIFSPGDPVQGVCIILRGRVEIAGEFGDEREPVVRRTSEWFGELEAMTLGARRLATARAVKPTSLFDLPGNPIELFRWLSDRKAAMRLLRNAICLMGRNLRELGEAESSSRSEDLEAPPPSGIWEAGEAAVPPGLMDRVKKCRSFSRMRLLDGQYLYREGDDPEGFYFVQSGTLDITRQSNRGQSRKLTTLRGPLIIGDVSFFSHQQRSVSLRAFGPVELLKFSGERFDRVRKRDAEEALDLLVLCADFAAGMLRVRQHAAAPRGSGQ